VHYPTVSRQLEKLWLHHGCDPVLRDLSLRAEVSKTVTGGYCSFPHCWGVQGESGIEKRRLLS